MTTVYASIGNSDDKLTQKRWSEYAKTFVLTVEEYADHMHGQWYSKPDTMWQNACICFELGDDDAIKELRGELAALAAEYGQDSIAWAVAETEFIKAAR